MLDQFMNCHQLWQYLVSEGWDMMGLLVYYGIFFARVSQRICPTALTGRCIKIKYAVIPVLDQYMIYLYWQRSLGRRISTLILVG